MIKMSINSKIEPVIAVKEKIRIKEPDRYKVVFLNDDFTPMEFVMGLLMDIFHHPEETAKEIMLKVHTDGKGIAGVYFFEIAEQKATESMTVSRTAGFPLQVDVEVDG
jgi:ATP-dependent Clp protease adaptor protein ClpS